MTQKITLSDLKTRAIDAHHANELDKAETDYRRYLKFRPKDYSVWTNLGALYRVQKRFQLAALAQQRAIDCDTPTVGAINNAANAYYDDGDALGAYELRLRLQELDPENPNHWAFGAKALRGLRRYDEAEKMAREGLRNHPDHVEMHLQLAFALLSKGDYIEGMREYDWRWQGDELTMPDLAPPKWQGEPLKDKSILIVPEQGFGDTVIMARFIEGIKEQGCQVATLVKKPLLRLFENLPGVDQFNPEKSDIGKFDFWVPYMDMPMYLGTTLDDLPKPTQMNIPKDSQLRAIKFLEPYEEKFNVGVLWSGSVTYRANHKRSFDHDQFLGLADIPNLQMHSLYKGPLHQDFLKSGSSIFISDAAGHDRDFADSAALMQKLDLVITMDSAIAHVAGSLDVPVWNLLHDNPYWLYEPFEETTPWYPSMKLVRQNYRESWYDVFKRVRKMLVPLVEQKTGLK